MYRIDKTTPLLIMATWRFDVIQNCLTLLTLCAQDKRQLRLNTFSYSKCWECFPPAFSILSQPRSKTRDTFVLRKIFQFSSVRFLIQKLFDFEARSSCEPPADAWVQIRRVLWPLFLLNHLQTVRVQALFKWHCAHSPCHSIDSSRLQSSINFGSRN